MEAALKINKVADVVAENSERPRDTLDVSDGSASQVLLKTLSHELRTPLNSIIGFADMMEQEMLGPMGTPQYRSYAHDICNSGRTMLRIMNDLLDQQRFARIQDSEKDFRHMIELAPDFISICRNDIIRVINPAGANMLGMWPVETLIGRSLSDFVHPDYRDLVKDGFTNLVPEKLRVPLKFQRVDGGEADVEIAAIPYEDDERNSSLGTVMVIARDVTERNRTIRKLGEREEHIRKIMDTVVDGILTIDQSGFIETVNPAAESLFMYRPGELSGQNISALLSQEPATHRDNFVTRFLAGKGSRPMGNRRPVAAIRKDGSVIPVEITIAVMKTGERNLFIAVVRDITERQKHEQRLRDMATRDPLTQMPNRTLFNERLDEELDSARSTGTRFAVIFVDLDHFKYINDAMGHVIGDRVIQQAGARLRNCVGPGDLMAHLGGDEFSAILSDIREDADVAAVASRMLATLAEPFQMEDREIFTSGSLGVVLYPEHAGTVSELIKNVDTACHKAKQEGRNNCQFYTQKLSADVKRRMEIESGLRRALENDEFSLYYQPKVDLRSHRLVGAEALLRWETDHMGFVSPAEFVPVAEDMGLIVPIGEWVLRNACADAAEWISDTDHPIHVGVNLSARQFLQGDLTEKVVNSLHESGLPPERLDLELTESMLVENPDQTIRTLESLRELGAHTSMDDFGTGYSSLSYLTRFPLDSLKIDRAFVTNLPSDKDSVAIATAIVSMAKNLQLQIVAEGIETKSQMRFLNFLGCRIGQGYLFSRPVPGLDFQRLIRLGSAAFNV